MRAPTHRESKSAARCKLQHSKTRAFHRSDMGSIKQRPTPSLTPELWAKVFAHLEHRPDPINAYNGLRQKQNQTQVHQLKLVCKQFRSICESHSEIVQRLYLDPHFSAAQVPGLLAWLQHNKGSIRVFWSRCTSSLVDAVMAGLASAPNMITVDIVEASACSVSLSGTYKRLEECTLRNHKAAHLGLAPLAALPRLRQLVLHGNFKELHHLTGLTRLDCVSGRVLGAHELPPALQHLELTESELVGVHAQTLPACTALARLSLKDAVLKGDNAYVYLDRTLSVVPTNIGQLRHLETLYLSTETHAEVAPVELKWVSELTSLQELSMHFDHARDDILQHVSLLTKLTYLEVSGIDIDVMDIVEDETCLLHVDIEWHKLQALRRLLIDFKRVRLGENVLGLLQLPNLQEFSFVGSAVASLEDTFWFAALIYRFARLRPQVKIVSGYGDLGGQVA